MDERSGENSPLSLHGDVWATPRLGTKNFSRETNQLPRPKGNYVRESNALLWFKVEICKVIIKDYHVRFLVLNDCIISLGHFGPHRRKLFKPAVPLSDGCGEKSRRKGGILLNVFSLSLSRRRRNSTLAAAAAAAKWLSRPSIPLRPLNRVTHTRFDDTGCWESLSNRLQGPTFLILRRSTV